MSGKETQLEGRVVVITGAARGMGAAYVKGFLSAGARVVATDKSWAGVDDFQRELATNEKTLALEVDVANDDAQIDKACEATLKRFGTVDVLVNNAAMLQMTLFPPTGRLTTLETKDEDWVKMFAVNLFGVLKVTRRFIKPMMEKQKGSIINVVSSGILNFSRGGGYTAFRPWSREMPYMSTKAALATMSFYLADEVKPYNISVNLIIPGHTRGSWFDDTTRARVAAGMRAGYRPVVPEHVLQLALFLASQDAKGVTGKMFDALEWNQEHGLGGYETWADKSLPLDLERVFSAGSSGPPGIPPSRP